MQPHLSSGPSPVPSQLLQAEPGPLKWCVLSETSLSSSHAGNAHILLCFCQPPASGPKGHRGQSCGPERVRLRLLLLPLNIRPCKPTREHPPADFPHQPPPGLKAAPRVPGPGSLSYSPGSALPAFSGTSTLPAAPPESERGKSDR